MCCVSTLFKSHVKTTEVVYFSHVGANAFLTQLSRHAAPGGWWLLSLRYDFYLPSVERMSSQHKQVSKPAP